MRIRKIVNGTPEQPRMTVFRSNKQIYVQFIDDLSKKLAKIFKTDPLSE